MSVEGLEAEGEELGAAGGITIHQGPQADLVSDAEAGETLDNHADHKTEHGGTAIKKFYPLELIQMDLAFALS